jgi:hypothetical protein
MLDEILEVDDLLSEPDQLPPLPVGGDIADLEGAPAPHLFEDEAEVVVAVEAPIDEVDAAPFPGQGLSDGLQVGEDGRLLFEESPFLVPHGLEDCETGHHTLLAERRKRTRFDGPPSYHVPHDPSIG